MNHRLFLPALALVAACSSDNATSSSGGQIIGDVHQLGATGSVTAAGGGAGAEYVLVAFDSAKTGATQDVRLASTNASAIAGTSAATEFALGTLAERVAGGGTARVIGTGTYGLAAHLSHLRHARAALAPRLPSARATVLARRAAGLAGLAAPGGSRGDVVPSFGVVPKVGDIIPLQTTNSNDDCQLQAGSQRYGIVKAVTTRAIVVADTSNPSGTGFSDVEYQKFGAAFDTLVFPMDSANFGAPTNIANNGGREILFFTRFVNELTAKTEKNGYIGGYFDDKDLFPVVADTSHHYTGCPASNQAEMFYLLVPDPSGLLSIPHTDAELTNSTISTLAHEFQHLINAGRRIYVNNASDWEETWLDEGLSHIAEELTFYRVTGLAPGQNLSWSTLSSTTQRENDLWEYQGENLIRYALYLQHPDTNSPYKPNDDALETRGATWSFLRYAADRKGGAQSQTWHALVNSTTSGLANLRNVFGDPMPLFEAWSVASYTDDAVSGVPAAYSQPSWDFRTVIPQAWSAYGHGTAFPLATRSLADGTPVLATLVGGGTVYTRFAVAAGKTATVTATGPNGAALPSTIQLTLVRTK